MKKYLFIVLAIAALGACRNPESANQFNVEEEVEADKISDGSVITKVARPKYYNLVNEFESRAEAFSVMFKARLDEISVKADSNALMILPFEGEKTIWEVATFDIIDNFNMNVITNDASLVPSIAKCIKENMPRLNQRVDSGVLKLEWPAISQSERETFKASVSNDASKAKTQLKSISALYASKIKNELADICQPTEIDAAVAELQRLSSYYIGIIGRYEEEKNDEIDFAFKSANHR